jgi:ABC-type antimicrobial peptide transport system permease subunit
MGIAAVAIAAVIGLGGAWLMLEVASVVGYRLDFAGIQPALDVPWDWLWPGIVLTLVVSCVAGVWAAWRIGRVPIDSLLTSYSGMR